MQRFVFLECLFKVQPRKHIFDPECQLIKLITAVFSSSPSAAQTYFSSPQAILFVFCVITTEIRDLIPMCMSYSIMKQLPFWQETTTWLDYFSRSKIIAVRHSHRLHSILICILRWLGIFAEAPPSQRLVSMKNLKQ